MTKSFLNILFPILVTIVGTIAVMSVQAGFVLLPAGWDIVYQVAMIGLVFSFWWRWQRNAIAAATPRHTASARVVVMSVICAGSIGVAHNYWVPLVAPAIATASARSPWSLIALLIAVGVAAPILEEALFRGYLLSRLRRQCGTTTSVLVSAALFAAVHDDSGQWAAQLAAGILLGSIMVSTGRMWLVVVTHSAFNLTGPIWLPLLHLERAYHFNLLLPLACTIVACLAALDVRRVLLATHWSNASTLAPRTAPLVPLKLDTAG